MSHSTYQHFLARLEATPQANIHLGLDVMRSAVQAERLQRPAPTIVTVAGTNGKGTVAAALSQLCTQRGWKTTLLTSPHLIDVRERIRINGAPIAKDVLAILGDPILQKYGAESAYQPRPLSYFELTILLGLRAAEYAQSDVIILEVGLGGQYDATNVIDADLAVFTSISLDHTALLGDTIEAIAYEKSCVARAETPALLHPELNGSDALRHWLTHHGALTIEASGGHDARTHNLALAQAAFSVLEVEEGHVSAPETIQEVLDDFQWPGRQTWTQSPRGIRVLLDGAHNAESAEELARLLEQKPPKQKAPAVLSLSGGRTVEDVVAPLAKYVRTYHVCAPDMDRVMPAKTLGMALHEWLRDAQDPTPQIIWHDSVEKALDAAEIEAKTNDLDGMLVFGSLYLVGEVYAHWWPNNDAVLSLSKHAATHPLGPVHTSSSAPVSSADASRTPPAFEGGGDGRGATRVQRAQQFLRGRWFPEDYPTKKAQRAVAFPRATATASAFSAIILMTIVTLLVTDYASLYVRLSAGTIVGNGLPAVVLILAFALPWGVRRTSFRLALSALWMGVVFSIAGTFLTGLLDEVFRWILTGTSLESWWTSLMEAREQSYDSLLSPKGLLATTAAFFTVSVWPGVFEEFLFRGAIYRLMQRLVVWRRVLFVGILFSFIHFDLVGFIPLAILGVLLTWLRALSGSWVLSALVHIAFNATALGISLWAHAAGLDEVSASGDVTQGDFWMYLLLVPVVLYAGYLFRQIGRKLLVLRENQ